MCKLFIGVMLIAGAVCAHAESNPDLVTQMYLDSELVYCDAGECVIVDTGETWAEPNATSPSYSVAFPEGKYTEEQTKENGPFIADAWKIRIQMMERDCTPPTISKKYKEMISCKE